MLEPIYNELAPRLNSYLKSISTKKEKTNEQQATADKANPNGKKATDNRRRTTDH